MRGYFTVLLIYICFCTVHYYLCNSNIYIYMNLTRQMSLVKPELLILPEHLSSSLVLVWFGSIVFCVMFCSLYIIVCSFVLVFFDIILSVLLRFMASDYPFGIFKLFFLPDVSPVYIPLYIVRQHWLHYKYD